MKTPGKFDVEIVSACDPSTPDSEYDVTVASERKETSADGSTQSSLATSATIHGKVESTGGWNKFVTRTLGTVTLDKAGRYTLSVKPTAMPHSAVMNLESVTLKPVKQ